MPRPFLFPWALALAAAAGCSISSASYRKVDDKSAPFQAAVAEEKARRIAEGVSPAEAEKLATRSVTTRTIRQEKDRRARDVGPLATALADLERPRGCWAFTATTKTLRDGRESTSVERYDPFQPPERQWTLLTRDGVAPDTDAQAAYRRKKSAGPRRSGLIQRRPDAERAQRSALTADFETKVAEDGTQIFAFDRSAVKVGLEQWGGSREVFTVESAAARLVSRQYVSKESSSFAGGSLVVERFESSIEYQNLEANLPPFPRRTTQRYRHRRLGADRGDVAIETVYSDYQRVTCYDDRFEVKIGLPSLSDLDPEKG